MKCSEFNKHIQEFIDNKLPDNKFDSFFHHYKTCKDCNEELEIRYLVHHVINFEEYDNKAFDLNESLNCHFAKMKDDVYNRYKFNFIRRTALIIAEALSSGAAAYYVLKLLNF